MKKILIVDDQAIIRKLVRLALRDYFELEEAGDADTAYAMILASRPDAIVLDVMMPGTMDGYQLCERLKLDPRFSDIYVVMVTARGQTADQESGRIHGANAYITKPFSPLVLAQHMKDALLVGWEVSDESLALADKGWESLIEGWVEP